MISFRGRIPRRTFNIFVFAIILINILIILAFKEVGPSNQLMGFIYNYIYESLGIIGVFSIVLSSSFITRRLHDLGLSAWYLLYFLIPLVSFCFLIILICKKGEPNANYFGDNPLSEMPAPIVITTLGDTASMEAEPVLPSTSPPLKQNSSAPAVLKSLTIITICFIAAICGLGFYLNNDAINAAKDELKIIRSQNQSLRDQNEVLKNEMQIYKYKSEFLDEKIGIVVEGGRNYHTVDCSLLPERYTFWAYNVEAAEVQGYGRCVKCH